LHNYARVHKSAPRFAAPWHASGDPWLARLARFSRPCGHVDLPRVPPDAAYAPSSAQDPVFAHGTSSIHGTGDGIVATRHCEVAGLPRGLPGCPWGARFGVRMGRGDGQGETAPAALRPRYGLIPMR